MYTYKQDIKEMIPIRVLELFSGYGTTTFALKRLNKPYKLIGYSDIDKYANQIFKQNHCPNDTEDKLQLGDITKIIPENLQNFDLLTAGFPCVSGDTLITTQRGSIPITDVVIGDLVLTHNNRWRSVTKTMSKTVNEYYQIRTSGSPFLNITPEHPIYCKKMIWTYNSKKRNNERIFSDPEWIETKELRKDDFIGFGTWSDKYATNIHNLTDVECYLIGRYVADGHITDSKRSGRKNSYNYKTIFCVGYNKVEEFERKIGKEYHTTKTRDRTVTRYTISNSRLMELCRECGRGAVNKKIPFFIMNLPVTKLRKFLEGYLDGDGFFNGKLWGASSVSRTLIYQIGQIVHRIYKTPYCISFVERPPTHVIEGRVVNQKDYWKISFQEKPNKQDNSVYINRNMWGRFTEKTLIKEPIIVYNLEVEEDNSYVANNLIVHNCQAFSQAGLMKGELDPRGTLFYEIIRIAKVKKPRYMLLENVKGLTTKRFKDTFNKILSELDRIGYKVHWKLLNTKDYGIPQNRDRVWFVCFKEQKDYDNFNWPEKEELKLTIKDILEDEVDNKYYLSEKLQERFRKYLEEKNKKDLVLLNPYNKRVDDKVSGTIGTSCGTSTGKTAQIVAMRSYPRTGTKEVDGERTQNLEPQSEPISNTLSSVQKDKVQAQISNCSPREVGFKDLCPTLAARDYKDPKVVGVYGINFENSDKTRPAYIQIDKGNHSQQDRYYQIENVSPTIVQNIPKILDVYNKKVKEDFCPTSTEPNHNNLRLMVFNPYNGKNSETECGTIGTSVGTTTGKTSQLLYINFIIRKLTPKECFRLQGFLNDEIDLSNLSDTQCYKMAGNGQSVNVVTKIFKEMFK